MEYLRQTEKKVHQILTYLYNHSACDRCDQIAYPRIVILTHESPRENAHCHNILLRYKNYNPCIHSVWRGVCEKYKYGACARATLPNIYYFVPWKRLEMACILHTILRRTSKDCRGIILKYLLD